MSYQDGTQNPFGEGGASEGAGASGDEPDADDAGAPNADSVAEFEQEDTGGAEELDIPDGEDAQASGEAAGAGPRAAGPAHAGAASGSAAASRKRFDIRFGHHPEGLTVHRHAAAAATDPETEAPTDEGDEDGSAPPSARGYRLVTRDDSASYLALGRGAYASLDLTEVPAPGSHWDAWTLTLDLRVAALPEQPQSLLQCNSDPQGVRHTEECFLYPSGAVGVFDVVGEDPTAWVKPGTWTRVTLRFGPRSSGTRELCVFVNGKLSTRLVKGVFEESGGRFSVPRAGLLLFASQEVDAIPGVDLRYVEFCGRALGDAEVREAQHASVYSQWEAERAREQAQLAASLSLHPLYKQPPFAWQDTAFVAEFGDACGAGMASAQGVFTSLRVFAHVARRAFEEQQSALDVLSADELETVRGSLEMLDASAALARRFELSRRNADRHIAFLRKWRKQLEALPVGESLLVPGGFATDRGLSSLVLLLERSGEEEFAVSVVNPGDGVEAWHATSPTSAVPKVQARMAARFLGVARDRLLDDGWWFMFWRLALHPMKQNTPDKFYDDLLPLLLGQPLEQALADSGATRDDLISPLRTPMRAAVGGYRSVREAWVHWLAAHGVSAQSTLALWLVYQQQWLKLVLHDLDCAASLDESDAGLVRMSLRQVAHVCTRRPAPDAPPRFHDDVLATVRATVAGVERKLARLPLRGYGSATRTLAISGMRAPAPEDAVHAWLERLRRAEDVNGLAGAAKQYPPFVPLDFLLVPERARTLDEGVDALRWADKLCTLASVQTARVQHSAYLKVALLQHLFTRVLPVPDASTPSRCFWHQPVRYALQLDVLLLLKRLVEHFASSAFAIRTSREFDAVKLVVSAAAAALGDVFLRKRATDIESEVSQVWREGRFGLAPQPFDQQSETIMVTVPELNVARTAILDYWRDVAPQNTVFNWTESMRSDEATTDFLRGVCHKMAFPYSGQTLPTFLSGEQWLILKNFPELEYFRDIAFYAKLFLSTDPRSFPPPLPFPQKQAELQWKWDGMQGAYEVGAFRMPLRISAAGHRWPSYAIASRFTAPHEARTEDDILHIKELPDFDGQLGQRDAEYLLSTLTVPYLRVPLAVSFFATEDRIHALRSRTLRTLLDCAVFEPARYLPKDAARSPEWVPAKDERRLNTPYGLLLNELAASPTQVLGATVRLMRLALALDTGSFFASQTVIILYILRFACRVGNFVQFLLDHAAGRTHASLHLRDVTLREPALATLRDSRAQMRGILEDRFVPMLRRWVAECVRRAQSLADAESSGEGQAPTGAAGLRRAPSASGDASREWLRQVSGDDEEGAGAGAGAGSRRRGQGQGQGRGRGRGRGWGRGRGQGRGARGGGPQQFARREPKRRNVEDLTEDADGRAEAAKDFDALFQIVSDLRSHIVLSMRNSEPAEWETPKLRRFVSLFTFLATRHTWNAHLLSIPEPEIWEVYQHCRRTLVGRLSALVPAQVRDVMEHTVSVVSDARKLGIPRGWGCYRGDPRHRGRFVACESSARCALLDGQQPGRALPRVAEGVAEEHMGIEVNVQLGQLTLRSNHLEALREPVSSDGDVVAVFGSRSLQCAVVEEAERRQWFRLVGRQHDIQYWDEDDRQDVVGAERPYDPSEALPGEEWIAGLWEPIRLRYYVPPQSPALEWYLRDQPHGADDDLAYIVGVDPESGGPMVEALLCRSLACANVFVVESHGRRWWRRQVYASDARFSLGAFQPSTKDRKQKWPQWGRYEAGNASLPEQAPSAVITREATLADNLAGTEEMYVPPRFLYGLLPACLLETHTFWMDDNDNLRGYADARDGTTGLPETVLLVEFPYPPVAGAGAGTERPVDGSPRARVSRRVLRDVRREWTEEELSQLRRTQESTEKETGLHNDRGMRRRPEWTSRQLDRGEYAEEEELVLLDALRAAPGSRLREAARCMATCESLSHTLFWQRPEAAAQGEEGPLHRVELPRLRFTLTERGGQLYSVDHSDLRVVDDAYMASRPEVGRLIRGLPHALVLANSNGEPQVLLPFVRPVRPGIETSPLSTELVMDRARWPGLGLRYLLLPVHVSLSFIQLPTLGSALYLLLLRFLARDYAAVQRLVPSVGTDAELAEEEAAALQEVSGVVDGHPDAHAARLHLTLSLMDAPADVKARLRWDLPEEVDAYLSKLSHVSMGSLLDEEAESTAIALAQDQIKMEDAVRDIAGGVGREQLRRFAGWFYDPDIAQETPPQEVSRHERLVENMLSAMERALGVDAATVTRDDLKAVLPKAVSLRRSPRLRCVLQNRRLWLSRSPGQTVVLHAPERSRATNWQWWRDDAALTAEGTAWAELQVTYRRQRALAGTQLDKFMATLAARQEQAPETMTGDSMGTGFLGLYEALTGTMRIRVGANDDSRTIAMLVWRAMSDGQRPGSVLSSIISILLSSPHLTDAMPRYEDSRPRKTPTLYGRPTDEHPVAPLATLLADATAILQSMAAADVLPPPLDPSSVPRLDDDADAARRTTVRDTVDAARAKRRPGTTDFMRDKCTLRAPDPAVLQRLAARAADPDSVDSEALASAAADDAARLAEVAPSADELRYMGGRPLEGIGFDTFVCELPPGGDVSLAMPFDVSAHPEARTEVAKQITSRLQEDLGNHEQHLNSATKLSLTVDMTDLGVTLGEKEGLLDRLDEAVTAKRERDLAYVQQAFAGLRAWANAVPGISAEDSAAPGAGRGRALNFALSRVAGAEAWASVDLVICALLSTRGVEDLRRANPFLMEEEAEELLALAVLSICHGTRVGQLNRVLSASRALRSLARELHEAGSLSEGLAIRMRQQLGNVTKNLTARRQYMDADGATFDPRYLVFEFVWNIVLFAPQVAMVEEFRRTLEGGGSMVRQLIMGSGKTTVVSPLLCLMLGDKRNLVVEVVPPALLEFSRSVLRSTFSSILQKRVYTFGFDRSSIMTEATLKKLRAARTHAGVVVSTPTAVKALMLRYVENMTLLRDRRNEASLAGARSGERFLANQGKLLESLRLFTDHGVLLCDEIDMLLHPLRSELNFPVGPKFDLDFAPQRWQFPLFIISALLAADRLATDPDFSESELHIAVPLARESERVGRALQALADALRAGYELRALQRVPHLVLLDDAFYEERIRPLATDLAVCWLEQHHFDAGVLGPVSLRQALADKHSVQPEGEAKGAEGAHRASSLSDVRGPQAKYWKQLNMCADWLASFVPHALRKIDRVTFGIMTEDDRARALEADPYMPRTRWKLSIPFVSKDVPSRSSEFAHPDVVIGLTFLAYRYEGLRREDFVEVVTALRTRMAKEMGPSRERPTCKLYAKWVQEAGCRIKGEDKEEEEEEEDKKEGKAVDAAAAAAGSGGEAVALEDVGVETSGTAAAAEEEEELEEDDEVVPLWLLKKSDDEQMDRLFRLLRRSPTVIEFFLDEIVYPTFMRHQQEKLSASGQEIGGDILFKRRVGFSGTPSSLLPLEMGSTQYEKGADGLMLTVMTDPGVVGVEVLADNWSVRSVLRHIARQPDESRFSALLDTGALITGMSNVEAATFLLDDGLPWCEGVVFMDEADRKCVLVRATRRVVDLDQCGIAATKLFALYDQVHTTGTDLKFLSQFNARAAQTLGKDMVWRDYVQGAWRMRQLGRGHTLRVLVIPEVWELAQRELTAAHHDDLLPAADSLPRAAASEGGEGAAVSAPLPRDTVRTVLRGLGAWLVINTMRSEKVQFQQLLLQNAANVWRKNAFRVLVQRSEAEGEEEKKEGEEAAQSQGGGLAGAREAEEMLGKIGVERALSCFLEPIDFSLDDAVEVVQDFESVISALVEKHRDFLVSAHDVEVIENIKRMARVSAAAGKADAGEIAQQLALSVEMVQEQEQEQEQEEESEKEQEVEIEKFVQVQVSREDEEPTPWHFETGIHAAPVGRAEDVDPEARPFYALRDFRLYKREPLRVPPFVAVSNNYFNPRWHGERRLRNTVCVLEYVPDRTMVRALAKEDLEMDDVNDGGGHQGGGEAPGAVPLRRTHSARTQSTLDRVFSLLDVEGSGALPRAILFYVLHGVLGEMASEELVDRVVERFGGERGFSLASLRAFLVSDMLLGEHGRQYVALSLAEAESLRRIVHLRAAELEEGGVELRLRILPLDFAVLDEIGTGTAAPASGSDGAGGASTGDRQARQALVAQQVLRFFDGEMGYSDRDVAVLLRALGPAACLSRQRFFVNVTGCRRRLQRKWEGTPLAKVFRLRSEVHLLLQHARAVRVRLGVRARALTWLDAFRAFDVHKAGVLTPGVVWGVLDLLGVEAEAAEVVDLLRAYDADGDGGLGWSDYAQMLRLHDPALDEADARAVREGAVEVTPVEVEDVTVLPRGEEQLREMHRELEKKDAKAEEEQLQRLQQEEEARAEALEAEEEARDRARGLRPNPEVEGDRARFDLGTGKLPKRVRAMGFVEYRHMLTGRPLPTSALAADAPVPEQAMLWLDRKSYLVLPPVFGDAPLVEWTVVMHMRVPHMPAVRSALLRTAPPTALDAPAMELSVQRDGAFGYLCDSSLPRIPTNKWCVVAFAVDAARGSLSSFLDGRMVSTLTAEVAPELLGGSLLVDPSLGGLCVMASGEDSAMGGGELREVQLFSRALTEVEVEGLTERMSAQGGWTCHACTYHNEGTAASCGVCGQPRPDAGTAAAAAGAGAGAGQGAAAGASGNELNQQLRTLLDSMGLQVSDEDIQDAIRRVGQNPDAIVSHIMTGGDGEGDGGDEGDDGVRFLGRMPGSE